MKTEKKLEEKKTGSFELTVKELLWREKITSDSRCQKGWYKQLGFFSDV